MTTALVLCLVAVGMAISEQLIVEGGFEGVPNGTVWQPFLSGFFRSDAQCRTGLCMSVTPHHFFGAWQHVRIPSRAPRSSVSLVAFVNSEWTFAVKATVSVTVAYADGTRASDGVLVENGVRGYHRVCRSFALEQKPVASVTMFVVASPLSQSYGTLFVDDVELWLSDAGDSPICEGEVMSPKTVSKPPALVSKVGPEPLLWESQSEHSGALCTVVVVQPRDSDYVARLSEVLRKSPVVVVLYAGQNNVDEEFSRMSGVISSKSGTLLSVVGDKQQGKFPLNALRSIGQSHCPHHSTHALHLEAGMIPSSSLHVERVPLADKNTIWVVPSFEIVSGPNAQIADKEALKKVSPRPLQIGRHVLSVFSTNHTQWALCTKDYSIRPVVSGVLSEELGRGVESLSVESMAMEPEIFNRHYAPVMIVPIDSVKFDSRFAHHGHERVSVVAEWMMRPGARFDVLCEGFVTRVKDGETPLAIEEHVSSTLAFRIWKTYYHFLGEKMVQHNAVHMATLFRAMPFVDESRDHRLDRPLGTRVMIALVTVIASLLVLRSLLRRDRMSETRRQGGMVKEL